MGKGGEGKKDGAPTEISGYATAKNSKIFWGGTTASPSKTLLSIPHLSRAPTITIDPGYATVEYRPVEMRKREKFAQGPATFGAPPSLKNIK